MFTKSGILIPNGTKSITTNGTHDVTDYENAEVNVPQGVRSGSIAVACTCNVQWRGSLYTAPQCKCTVNFENGAYKNIKSSIGGQTSGNFVVAFENTYIYITQFSVVSNNLS